jgi:glycosyltransferase involved in cell wall biosynthesis
MPLFSVILPAHDAEQTLTATLVSLVRQSCDDWEAIVLDDGSTDRTAKIANALACVDKRVRIVSLPGVGPSAARNIGGLAARGQFLAFLDSDDLWVPEKLAVCARALRASPGTDGLFGRVAFFEGDPSHSRTESRVRPGRLALRDLIGENPVCTMSNLVVRASSFRAVGGFDESLRHAEDLECLIRLVASGAVVAGLDRHLVYYRTSPFGLSADLSAMHAGWRRAVETAIKVDADLRTHEVRAAEAAHLRYLARRALRVNTPSGTALRLSMQGLAASPAAFFAPLDRSVPTLAAALIEPLMPSALRRRLARL